MCERERVPAVRSNVPPAGIDAAAAAVYAAAAAANPRPVLWETGYAHVYGVAAQLCDRLWRINATQ